MPYLEATLLEIQRMANTCQKCFEYPLVAIISTSIGLYVLFPFCCIVPFSVTFSLPHVAKKDTKLQGFDIPKDAIIIANLYSAHIDEKYWKDPEKFIPERFLNEDGSLRRRDAFIPFSAGIFSFDFCRFAYPNIFTERPYLSLNNSFQLIKSCFEILGSSDG